MITHIKHIIAALLFGALVSVDVDAGMGSLIAGDNHIMLVNRQYEFKRHPTHSGLWVRDMWVMPEEKREEDCPRIVKVTSVRDLTSRVVMNALVYEESGELPGAPVPEPVKRMHIEIVRPGSVLQHMNADNYVQSLPDGSQVYVWLDYD